MLNCSYSDSLIWNFEDIFNQLKQTKDVLMFLFFFYFLHENNIDPCPAEPGYALSLQTV